MTNEEIQNIFFLECEEALAAAEQGLLDCRGGAAEAETVNSIFRAVHSIKGGAGAFSFTELQAFTHKFETVLSYVRDGELELSDTLTTLLLRAFDLLADHVASVRGTGSTPDDAAVSTQLEDVAARAANGERRIDDHAETPAEPVNISEAADDLGLDFDLDGLLGDLEFTNDDDVAGDTPAPALAEVAPEATVCDAAHAQNWRVVVRPQAQALANGGEPLFLLRELLALGGRVQTVHADSLPVLGQFDADASYLGWTCIIAGTVEEQAIRDIFDFVGEDVGIEISRTDTDIPEKVQVELPEIRLETPPVAEAAPAPVTKPAPAAEAANAAPASAPISSPAPAETASAAAPRAAAAAVGQTVRVDLAKLDRLIDTVGELVIAQAMMAQKLGMSGLNVMDEMGMLDQLTREIQESTMAIRAQPIGSVFSRVPRIVRELEADTGKRVLLTMAGESTELDKTVVERLGEPLTHLIRNAVDHGIETPEVRIAAGKAPEGRLLLSAEQRAGRIVISLSDDGAGINREAVLKKAIEKGIVGANAQLSNEEIDNLIFAPGFSTAEKVSNISGRGVGMDVVRQNVKDLGGRITIESHPGKGCIFTLALPLTLAIADGMIVQVGDQTAVIPLTHVIESLRPGEAEVQRMGTTLEMLNNRGRFLPILPLDRQVSAIGATNDPSNAVLIVVETESNGQAALMVDEIIDQRQFVIKSLESNFQQVQGVAGATILGDGQVSLILDVDGVVAQAFSANASSIEAARAA